MSTVLRPVGPEPAQTYWLRRIAVIGVAIVVLAVAGALIANGTSSGSAVQANPSPPPPTGSTALASSATPTVTPSAGAAASSSSTTATANPSPTSASTTATPKPSKTPTREPVACTVSELRPTLTGKQRLKIEERSAFALSVINGSDQTCIVTVNPDNFELRVYSGIDRIWSTKDCATLVKPLRRTLKAEEALEWKLTWNGLRSRSGCKAGSEIPQAGTYWATANLAGAEPVRLRMTLRN
jgi:hypothetical protein